MARSDPYLFSKYFQLVAETEPPLIYHRWSLVTSLGAFLGRRFHLPFGMWRIFPNIYTMLMGNPGTRKNTAINLAKHLIAESGYAHFSANKTRLEKFLLDLEGEITDDHGNLKSKKGGNLVFENLFGGEGRDNTDGLDPREVFIVAPEFNTFMPRGDLDFLGDLGELWDWDDEKSFWKFRLKNSKQVHIFQPTISILGGNTHAGFQEMFPPQSLGQGFLSRLILVYSEPSGRKITFPPIPSPTLRAEIVKTLIDIRQNVVGIATKDSQAEKALEMIYRSWHDLEDQRFKHYSTRRFTHLLKLCLVCAASRVSTTITLQDVVLANSLLTYTEVSMPKALGEFGKSRNAEAANKIMQALYETKKPLQFNQIWKIVSSDLNKMTELAELLNNLTQADKIQNWKGQGFLPKHSPLDRTNLYVDYNLLKEHTDGTK